MRFCYLRIALLTGILAATASADSTRTNLKSATLREELPPRFDRDGIAAIGASVGHEDRAGPAEEEMNVSKFIREVLLSNSRSRRKAVDGLSEKYAAMVKENISPQKLYRKMVGGLTRKPLLTSKVWRKWAFFASKYCAKEGKDPHEYIAEVMLNHHGARMFSVLLAAAANKPSTKHLVKKLQEVQISLWLKKHYRPQDVFDLLQLRNLWTKHFFVTPQFATWTRYMQRLHEAEYAVDPIGTEVRGLCEFIEHGPLLKMLTLPKNLADSRGPQYLEVLMSIMVDDLVDPEDVLAMLLQGVNKDNDQLTSLLMNGPVRKFWMAYVTKFNDQYSREGPSICETLTPIFGLPKLMRMLREAVIAPDKYKSGVAFLYFNLQFAEWRTSGVKTITDIVPALTEIPPEDWPTIRVVWLAYLKYCEGESRLLKADFIL